MDEKVLSKTELEDAEVERELAEEAEANRQKKKTRGNTVLAAVCGALACLAGMLVFALLTKSVPVVLFAAGPLSVWGFSKLFKGGTGRELRWAAAIAGVVVLYFGACLDAAGLFMVTNGVPASMLFTVFAAVIASSWLFATAGASLLYALIFSVLGFFLVWEFTGNPFRRRQGIKRVETAPVFAAEEAAEETEETEDELPEDGEV